MKLTTQYLYKRGLTRPDITKLVDLGCLRVEVKEKPGKYGLTVSKYFWWTTKPPSQWSKEAKAIWEGSR